MREPAVESPNLFDLVPDPGVVSEPAAAGGSLGVAGDFVRWLFSFGADFRNSPDMTNLRFWLRQQRMDVQGNDEQEIIGRARLLFAKRLEKTLRKSETRSGAGADTGSIGA
ncbi:MAG TPA: hypothetical protein VFY29_09315 [Terriglobia bacterium]|nr:hypothetical protein [Terriglobia bacterium]